MGGGTMDGSGAAMTAFVFFFFSSFFGRGQTGDRNGCSWVRHVPRRVGFLVVDAEGRRRPACIGGDTGAATRSIGRARSNAPPKCIPARSGSSLPPPFGEVGDRPVEVAIARARPTRGERDDDLPSVVPGRCRELQIVGGNILIDENGIVLRVREGEIKGGSV